MVKIEIKSVFGKVLFTYEKENATIKGAVEQAVKEKVSLNYANLESADLRSADLRSADLRSASLCSADLRSANLRSANLRSANLRSANLESANLESADLRWADFRSANLESADLNWADLESANLESAENKETAYLPIFCKRSFSVVGNKIQIGCKQKTIKGWDLFFASKEVYSTERNTEDFKQIQAVYNALKSYLLTLNNNNE